MKKGKSRKIRRSILFLLIGSLVVIAALVGIRMWGDEEDGMLSAKTLASTYGEGLMEDASCCRHRNSRDWMSGSRRI